MVPGDRRVFRPSGRRVVGREQIAHLALGLSLSALGFDWAATADEDDDEDDDNQGDESADDGPQSSRG